MNDEAGGHHTHQHNSLPPFVDVLPPGPFYDVERSANVTALVNQPAELNCRVNKIGNRTVSEWWRCEGGAEGGAGVHGGVLVGVLMG